MKITKKVRAEVLMEAMQSDLKVVLEYVTQIPDIKATVDKHTEQLERLQDDVDALKTVSRSHTQQLESHTKQLERIETKLTSKADTKRVEIIERKLGLAHA